MSDDVRNPKAGLMWQGVERMAVFAQPLYNDALNRDKARFAMRAERFRAGFAEARAAIGDTGLRPDFARLCFALARLCEGGQPDATITGVLLDAIEAELNLIEEFCNS